MKSNKYGFKVSEEPLRDDPVTYSEHLARVNDFIDYTIDHAGEWCEMPPIFSTTEAQAITQLLKRHSRERDLDINFHSRQDTEYDSRNDRVKYLGTIIKGRYYGQI